MNNNGSAVSLENWTKSYLAGEGQSKASWIFIPTDINI